jgi:3-oxoadipate enol-lactonase
MPGVELTIPVPGGEVWAQDSDGDGLPLILLHPGWGDSTIWDPMMGRLTGTYRVIRYDTRGYGRSPAPVAAYTQLGDLTAVLDHLGVARAAIVGHSGGGGTAIGLALAEPARVAALVLVAPGVQDYPWPEDDPYFVEGTRLFEADDREGALALGLRTWAAAGADETAQAQIRGAVTALFRPGNYEQPDPPAYPRLGEIGVPSVLAIGDLDYPLMHDCAERIAGGIPGCGLIVVPGADHLLPLRTPDALADIIDARVIDTSTRA